MKVARKVFKIVQYEGSFEEWYRDIFPEYIMEATKCFDTGCSDPEVGASIHISKMESKDGCSHEIFVSREDFEQFFGKEYYENCFLGY